MPRRYKLLVPRQIFEATVQQAVLELPNECCGLLAGIMTDHGIARVSHRFPLFNVRHSPVAYDGDEKDLFIAFKAMRAENIDLLAVYHSHPTSPPVPSRTDCARNACGEDMVHLIISLETGQPQVRAWRLSESSFEEAEWECMEDDG